MATGLEPHKTTSKSEAYLQRQFAEICARMKRVDVLTCLLALALTVSGYALLMGLVDLFSGGSDPSWVQVTRWCSYGVFVGLFGFLMVRLMRCLFRRINPFYVARQLEETLPDAKNSLINWLDLHQENLPAAFRKNLSGNAVEHFKECEPQRTVWTRKNGIMLGAQALPALILLILLIYLGPAAFFSSMAQAFLPFLETQRAARTQITLLLPETGDAEVSPAQAVTFSARIEGRVPTGMRADAPLLHYRYQANDDFLTLPLQSEGNGAWTAQLFATQLRSGFAYKITAGDAATPEYQVRVRARAHVQQYEITYHHRPYRKLARATATFPNEHASRPMICGPRGTEVELVVHASRPVRQANVEILTKNARKDLPVHKLPTDPHAVTCRFTLEQPAQFRVAFTSIEGEENTDRDLFDIDVLDDEAPRVVLNLPGKDVSLPANATLELEGLANDDVGLKNVALHLRVFQGPDGPDKPLLQTKPYRAGKSLQRAVDGTYPTVIEYKDFVSLNQLKDTKGGLQFLLAGTVLEYWLEATDNSDYPDPKGNVGKSVVYKLTLLPALADDKQVQAQRQRAEKQQKEHEKRQDDRLDKESKQPQKGAGGTGSKGLQEQINKTEKDTQSAKDQLNKALKQDQQPNPGKSKDANPKPGENKPGPQDSADSPNPEKKNQKPMSPDDAGKNKDQGSDKGQSGASKDSGDKGSAKEDSSKGDRKDGPKESSSPAKEQGGMDKKESAAGAKDAGPMGMNTPPMPQPKGTASEAGAPMPQAKQDMQNEAKPKEMPSPEGTAKGAEQNGPELPNKDQKATPNPEAKAKAGMNNDPNASKADAKPAPQDQPQEAGNARGDDGVAPKERTWDDIAKLIEKLPNKDKSGEDAGKELATISKEASDERKRDIAKDALEKNQRDPDTGKEIEAKPMQGTETKPGKDKKGPNKFGSSGKSPGIGDDVKAAAANREFARKIGQMQLDDWKKRMTPSLLKKAGLTEAEWQQFLSNMQTYDALVRQWNAQLAKGKIGDKRGNRPSSAGSSVLIEGPATSNDPLDSVRALPPSDLRDAQRRFSTRQPGP